MSFKVIIKPRAEIDITDVINWYKSKSNEIKEKFCLELHKKMEIIAENPFLFPVKYSEVIRMTTFKDFPYSIYYIINEENKIVFILALLHESKNPDNRPTIDD